MSTENRESFFFDFDGGSHQFRFQRPRLSAGYPTSSDRGRHLAPFESNDAEYRVVPVLCRRSAIPATAGQG